jgi:hypothetical protein
MTVSHYTNKIKELATINSLHRGEGKMKKSGWQPQKGFQMNGMKPAITKEGDGYGQRVLTAVPEF